VSTPKELMIIEVNWKLSDIKRDNQCTTGVPTKFPISKSDLR
jgi:hypothetical protein